MEGPSMNEQEGPEVDDDTAKKVRQIASRMPDRPILDFLVQYFIAEVDWFVFLALHAVLNLLILPCL